MLDKTWYKSKIIRGKKIGKMLGYPTINLDNPEILKDQAEGVYAASVKIKEKKYQGILYFGPRLILGERGNILEIFVFDFSDEIYGEIIRFKLIKYIRPPRNFPDIKSFGKQLIVDCQKAKTILSRFLKS